MSIGSHLVADGGTAVKKLNLFRGAIMESGAPSGFVYMSRKFFVIAEICVIATVLASFRPNMLTQHINH